MNLLGSLFIVALIFTIFVTSVSAGGTALRADIVKCDPNPAQIGQYVNVWIKIENIGNTRAEYVSVGLIPSYPFSLDTGDDYVRNIDTLSTDRHALLEYNLYVDENATPGTRAINVLYQDDKGTAWVEETLDIQVGSSSDTFDSKETIQDECPFAYFLKKALLYQQDSNINTVQHRSATPEYRITIKHGSIRIGQECAAGTLSVRR
jgi:hypothetical protein